MKKIGKIVAYDSYSGIISSENQNYVFLKSDLKNGEVSVGDEVMFISEIYPRDNAESQKLTARFVFVIKKKLSMKR